MVNANELVKHFEEIRARGSNKKTKALMRTSISFSGGEMLVAY